MTFFFSELWCHKSPNHRTSGTENFFPPRTQNLPAQDGALVQYVQVTSLRHFRV